MMYDHIKNNKFYIIKRPRFIKSAPPMWDVRSEISDQTATMCISIISMVCETIYVKLWWGKRFLQFSSNKKTISSTLSASTSMNSKNLFRKLLIFRCLNIICFLWLALKDFNCSHDDLCMLLSFPWISSVDIYVGNDKYLQKPSLYKFIVSTIQSELRYSSSPVSAASPVPAW